MSDSPGPAARNSLPADPQERASSAAVEARDRSTGPPELARELRALLAAILVRDYRDNPSINRAASERRVTSVPGLNPSPEEDH